LVIHVSSKRYVKPKWIEEWRRRTRIISIIELAFEHSCDCEVCKELRDLGMEMEDMMQFTQPPVPMSIGGEQPSKRKRRKK